MLTGQKKNLCGVRAWLTSTRRCQFSIILTYPRKPLPLLSKKKQRKPLPRLCRMNNLRAAITNLHSLLILIAEQTHIIHTYIHYLYTHIYIYVCPLRPSALLKMGKKGKKTKGMRIINTVNKKFESLLHTMSLIYYIFCDNGKVCKIYEDPGKYCTPRLLL